MQKFLCKNHAGRQIKFDGHSVPSGAYYGQTSEEVRFIAVVKGNKIGMVWRVGKGLNQWQSNYNQTVVNFIRNEFVVNNPEVRQFDRNDAVTMQNAQRYNHRFKDCQKCGFSSFGHKPSKHTKAFRGRDNFFTAEYNDTSKAIYGDTVEIGGKPQKVHGKIAEYMDGNGLGRVRGDMRPLEPVMPIPSGRVKR